MELYTIVNSLIFNLFELRMKVDNTQTLGSPAPISDFIYLIKPSLDQQH